MLKTFTLTCLLLLSPLSQAAQKSTLYQVDMIVFTHPSELPPANNALAPVLVPNTQNAIPLQVNAVSGLAPYRLLPSRSSQLGSELWALNRNAEYQVLAHYTWLQPANNQRAIALPATNRNGWNIEGTLRVRQSNYYLLDAELLFLTPNNSQTAFLFSHKQRLKPGTVYYLDHPQAGMLIKVHQVA